MERLIQFIVKYRAFFTFVLLQLFCLWLLIQNNQYQGTRFFNSSNQLAASILEIRQNVHKYFLLNEINTELAKENTALREELSLSNQLIERSKRNHWTDTIVWKDTLTVASHYEYISAKVINNSTQQYKNFITIDRGSDDGIQPGMAVISAQGAIGKVKIVTKHYAVIMSLLNIDEHVSCKISRTGHFGTAQWDGINAQTINLKYIPRHVTPVVGDTILTSGFNAIFPANIMIGKIKNIKPGEDSPFYRIEVALAQDFGKLSYVDVVKNNRKAEQDTLALKVQEILK